MKYQCLAENCKKTFSHPAKYIVNQYSNIEQKNSGLAIIEPVVLSSIEEYVCPFCKGKEFAEYVEPLQAEQKTVAVLVVDLVSGENLALNKALADGYEIVSRYSKSYTLEKKDAVATKPSQEPQTENTTASYVPIVEPCRNPHEIEYRGCSKLCSKWKDCTAIPKQQKEEENSAEATKP